MDDDRKLTVIVVPHGDLETRSYEIPYGRLKLAIAGLVLLFLAVAIVLATWFPVLAQSTRVRSLERQLEALEEKQAEVVKLAEALEEVEAQYERVRTLLGADAPVEGQPPLLPPLRRDTAPSPAPTPEEDHFLQGMIERPPRSTGEHRIHGRYAISDHGNGLETLYGHASRSRARAGARAVRRRRDRIDGLDRTVHGAPSSCRGPARRPGGGSPAFRSTTVVVANGSLR
jgi:hypothetical protein